MLWNFQIHEWENYRTLTRQFPRFPQWNKFCTNRQGNGRTKYETSRFNTCGRSPMSGHTMEVERRPNTKQIFQRLQAWKPHRIYTYEFIIGFIAVRRNKINGAISNILGNPCYIQLFKEYTFIYENTTAFGDQLIPLSNRNSHTDYFHETKAFAPRTITCAKNLFSSDCSSVRQSHPRQAWVGIGDSLLGLQSLGLGLKLNQAHLSYAFFEKTPTLWLLSCVCHVDN